MFNSETLEVGIGMAFLFLLMSLICTGIKEWIEGVLKWRAMDLERALRTLLDDNSGRLSAYFFSHPLIASLYQGSYDPGRLKKSLFQSLLNGVDGKHMPLRARRNLPSYIPADQFAKALIDIVGRGPATLDSEHTAPGALTLDQLRERAAALTSPSLRRVLLSAIDHADGTLKQATENVQHWFDSGMDRASGWYKRRTQSVLFALGIVAAIALNVDALYVMGRLTADKTLREAVVNAAAKAEEPARSGASGASGADGMLAAKKARQELSDIGMPVGWLDDEHYDFGLRPVQSCATGNIHTCSATTYSWGRLLVGWLISAFAVMLGAPFWFDILNKFMVVRSTVKPREKSPEEDSKDREDASTRQPEVVPERGPDRENGAGAGAAAPAPAAPTFMPHVWRDGMHNPMEIPL